MDVKTTFLNSNFDQSIYMMQQDSFIAKGQEHIVCKLHKSIYGLKKHLAHGTNVSIRQSRLLNLIKTRINLVCTKRFREA